jgi:peptidase S24-like
MNKKIALYKFLAQKRKLNVLIEGRSMYPTLQEGDEIFIINDNEYCIGNVVAFMYNNELVAHRLLKIENDVFFCKGDNAITIEAIYKYQLIGIVIQFKRKHIVYDIERIRENETQRVYKICAAINSNYLKNHEEITL